MSKSQTLFYGSPGNGKTFEVREETIRIINPLLDEKLKSNNIYEKNDKLDFRIINKAFESFFEYDENENVSNSKFLHEREYKPGKTCYRNMSALNKFMHVMISKGYTSITKDDWPDKGPSTFVQYSRSVTNFNMATEGTIEKGRKIVILNKTGKKIKEEYIKLLNNDPNIELNSISYLPEFAKNAIINSIRNTDETDMSMWKSTIIGALWFISRNGFIFKYSTPKRITRTKEENELLRVCFGYESEDNEFLGWVTPYLEGLGLVVERPATDPRHVSNYFLSSQGEELLKDMKIIKKYLNSHLIQENDDNSGDSIYSNDELSI